MKRIAAQELIERLADGGVDTIFGLPGRGINWIMEGPRKENHVVPRHQARPRQTRYRLRRRSRSLFSAMTRTAISRSVAIKLPELPSRISNTMMRGSGADPRIMVCRWPASGFGPEVKGYPLTAFAVDWNTSGTGYMPST